MIDNFYKFLEKKKNDIKNELNNITTDVSKMMNQLSCKNNIYVIQNIIWKKFNLYLLHLNEGVQVHSMIPIYIKLKIFYNQLIML